jgi:hypothetical protein
MRPIWFKDLAEMQCLTKEVSANWTLNLKYWTGATQQSCWGQWSWCSGDAPDPLNQALNWAVGQPDNANGTEACVNLQVFKNGSTLALSDRNCNSKYFMACKVCISVNLRQQLNKLIFCRGMFVQALNAKSQGVLINV